MNSIKEIITMYNKICLDNDMLPEYTSDSEIVSDVDIDYINHTIKFYLNFSE